MSFIYTYLYILWFFPLSYTPPFWSCLCWASLSRKSVWETNKKVHWLNIQSDTEARVRSRTRTHARTQCERGRVRRGGWCESRWHRGVKARAHVHVRAHTPTEKCLVTVSDPTHPRCLCVGACVSGGGSRAGGGKCGKFRKGGFHSISNSYLAHLTSIK